MHQRIIFRRRRTASHPYRIVPCHDQRTHLLNARDDADQASQAKANAILAGVAAHPGFGDDSSLYEAMGRTRKSERASGLTKKGKGSGGATPPPAP